MSTWVTHLMVADKVLQQIPELSKHEFLVGNIAPDCNVENEDWTSFTPSREVTHWMSEGRKVAADCDRFLYEYVNKREKPDEKEESFLLGYYAHLIVDAEFQRHIRDEERVKSTWERIKKHPELSKLAAGMEETWDSVKVLISRKDRGKDIYSIEIVELLMSIYLNSQFQWKDIETLTEDQIRERTKRMIDLTLSGCLKK